MPLRTYKELDVWQVSMELADEVYTATLAFSPPHRLEIGGQMRRAALSVPSNIAEGYRQRSPRAYVRYLRIAAGSLAELETQAELAKRRHMLPPEDAARLVALGNRVGGMLNILVTRLAPRV